MNNIQEFTPDFFDKSQKMWRLNKVRDGQSFRYIYYNTCNEKNKQQKEIRRSPRLLEKSKLQQSNNHASKPSN